MQTSSPIETIQTLGKYTLLEKIGEGYLGSVFRGFDQDLDQAVAVRVLCSGIKWDADIERIYTSQCQAIAGLRHASIASVLAFGTEGNHHYIVLESLGNSNLKNLIAQKPAIRIETKLSLMIQIAEGLSHAHKSGISHRDLGPSKIHLTADGKAKIRDFAIAGTLQKHLPHPWIRFGTPIYLSPEQVQQNAWDHRSDIFSAGTVFYELITYHHPFQDRDSNKALDNILQDSPVPTFDQFPDEPPGIWPILKNCLERNPDDRFQSMEELADACRCLQKDLAEDSRLMLSELYAALPSLRLATAKPDAPAGAIALRCDIEKLLRGEKEADYFSLDRLMNSLLDLYPAVQAISDSLSMLDPTGQELAPEACVPHSSKTALRFPNKPDPLPNESMVATGNKGPVRDLFEDLWDFPSDTQLAFETSFIKADEGTPCDSNAFGENESPEGGAKTQTGTAHAQTDASMPSASLLEQPAAATANPSQSKIDRTPRDLPQPNRIALPPAIKSETNRDAGYTPPKKSGLATCYRRIRTHSYRTTVVLLSLLLIAAAAYIVWGTDLAASLTGAMKARMPDSSVFASALARFHDRPSRNVSTESGREGQSAPSRAPAAIPAASDHSRVSPSGDIANAGNQPAQDLLSRISTLIAAGKLSSAKAELDKMQRSFPSAPQIVQLRKQWEFQSAAMAQEKMRHKEALLNAGARRLEEEWNRRLSTLLARGQYGEAGSALNRWLSEDPNSPAAQAAGSQISEIQRNLNTYATAMSENRYPEALAAILNAERLNPADSNFAELRRQTEARRAAARSYLSVYRLGAKATILLDGRSVGSEGELENESVSVGHHTIAVESSGSPALSKRHEFMEGQRISLVYDIAAQQLRSMADSDRDLRAQRKTMEEVRYFDVEHDHGAFRGSCRGLLMIDYLDVAYRPSAGFHGFRIPFKLLRLQVKGKSANLINASDNKTYQNFTFRDAQDADKFRRSWDELKSLSRQ